MADTLDFVTGIPSNALGRPSPTEAADVSDVRFLIDGDGYFCELDRQIRQAKQTIWIVGWDFDPDIQLRPGLSSETLGSLLQTATEANPGLQVRILIWGMGPIYSGKSLRLFRQNEFPCHPRIQLRFDFGHPVRGCHHQKLVCIDDRVAFVGGIDLTARRWDDRHHKPSNDLRREPRGKSYGPVHDLQAMVSGSSSVMIGDVARQRWLEATGEAVASQWSSLRPAEKGSQFRVRLAITEPRRGERKGRREGIALTHELLRSAKDHIYIETQYLASFGVGRVLAKRLAEESGPEIVVLVTRSSHGLIEKIMMGTNRDRLIRRLKRIDRHNRLRVMYPVVPHGDGEQEVLVHSKLIIADDRMVRIGSSNLNNRSEGIDSECDALIEARTPEQRLHIADLRARLLAEHMDCAVSDVVRSMDECGSINETIGRLNTGRRCLRHFPVDVAKGAVSPVPGTDIVDPRKPYFLLRHLRLKGSVWRNRIASWIL